MTRLEIDQRSLKWDEWDASHEAIKESMGEVGLVGLTETNVMFAKLRRFARAVDWDITPPGEVAIISDPAVWHPVRLHTKTIGKTIHGRTVQVALGFYRHVDTGDTVLVSECHVPAHVEGKWFRRARSVVRHMKLVQKWRWTHYRWRRRLRPDAEIALGDRNLNLYLRWVRAYVRASWGGLNLPPRPYPGGSHAGNRLIDWFQWAGLAHVEWHRLPQVARLDHWGIRISAIIKTRPRRRRRRVSQ